METDNGLWTSDGCDRDRGADRGGSVQTRQALARSVEQAEGRLPLLRGRYDIERQPDRRQK